MPDFATSFSIPCSYAIKFRSIASACDWPTAVTFNFTAPACCTWTAQSTRRSPPAGTVTAPCSPLAGTPSFKSPVTTTPSASNPGWTSTGPSLLLFITAETTVESPTTKNLGDSSRTINGCFVRVLPNAIPNLSPVVIARAVAVQLVSESGNLTLTVALPFESVATSGCQNAVDLKSFRTVTAAPCCSGVVTIALSAATGLGAAIPAESAVFDLASAARSSSMAAGPSRLELSFRWPARLAIAPLDAVSSALSSLSFPL